MLKLSCFHFVMSLILTKITVVKSHCPSRWPLEQWQEYCLVCPSLCIVPVDKQFACRVFQSEAYTASSEVQQWLPSCPRMLHGGALSLGLWTGARRNESGCFTHESMLYCRFSWNVKLLLGPWNVILGWPASIIEVTGLAEAQHGTKRTPKASDW